MNGKIIKREEVAKGTIMVEFGEFDEQPVFKPGQYMFVTLPQLNYEDERGNRRHFSIVNSPNEKGILRMTTRVTESGFKKTLNELPMGTSVQIGPIAGVFVLPEDTQRPLVLIAGGIGITPYMSMLTYVEEQKLPYNIKMFYSNSDQASTAYFQELKAMGDRNPNINIVFIMTQDQEWQGESRHLDPSILKEYLNDVNQYYFMVVGPPAMVDAIMIVLDQAGVPKENIKKENFSGY